jgi:hypothetical protein
MLRKPSIESLIHLIKDKIEQIETRYKRRWQIDITRNGHLDIVFRAYWIGCCQDRRSGIQGCDDTGFGDGNRLLFLRIQNQLLVHVAYVEEKYIPLLHAIRYALRLTFCRIHQYSRHLRHSRREHR